MTTSPYGARKSIRTAVAALIVLILIGIAFVVGESLGQKSMLRAANKELSGVQAMLAFNEILSQRHVGSLIARGCESQAAAFLAYMQDQDTQLLAGYLRDGLDDQTLKYISDRDASFLNDLTNFHSRYGTAWVEKTCPSN